MCEALKKLKEQSSGSGREEELQEEVSDLRTQLEQFRKEQAALLKAELAAARAAWNRDKQQEVAAAQMRSEQEAREEVARREKELLLQAEAKLLQRAEEQGHRLRGELLAELRTALADVQVHFLASHRADEPGGSGGRTATSQGSVTHIIQTSCRDVISRAVVQAKDEWRKVSSYQTVFEIRLQRLISFFICDTNPPRCVALVTC